MKKFTVLLIVLLLSSCTSLRYGNFTHLSQTKESYLALDAANQLTKVYPPAHNTMCTNQRVTDLFGMSLVQTLQKRGYEINEKRCLKAKSNFFYVLDELEPQDIYRVSLFVGTHSLNRVYVQNHEKILPASAWTHKE